MDSTDRVIAAVHDACMPYNTYLLKGFREQEMGRIVNYTDTMFREAIKLFDGQGLTYEGYRYLTPEERTTREIAYNTTRSGVNIRPTEASLIEFQFKFNDIIYPVPLYLPYLKDGFVIIKGVRYGLQYVIMEKSFSRNQSGITIKCLRSPVHFARVNLPINSIFSALDHTIRYHIPLLSVRIYQKKTSVDTKIPTTIVHYLMCEFGYKKTLMMLGINPDKMVFVDEIDPNSTDKYEYLYARKISKSKANIYLRIDRDIWDDINVRKVAGNIVYILQLFSTHEVGDLYEEDGTIYRIYLGKCLHGRTTAEPRAKAHADQHLSSLVTYLDPTTRERLRTGANINVNNIHELFISIFNDLEYILTNTRRSDMLDSRIDILDSLLVPTLVSNVYNLFYKIERKQNQLREKDVKDLLRISAEIAIKASKNPQNNTSTPTLQGVTALYSDNILTAMNIRRIRSGSSSQSMEIPENRFDPSIAIVTSINAFSDQNPGAVGHINPYLEINPDGSIIRTELAQELDAEIRPYLPYS